MCADTTNSAKEPSGKGQVYVALSEDKMRLLAAFEDVPPTLRETVLNMVEAASNTKPLALVR